MNIKDLFDSAEDGTLTWEQFEEAVKSKNAKFVDLSEGNYVSKSKYDADTKELNAIISTRDTDLGDLKKKLNDAGVDATKLQELTKNISELQEKYDNDVKDYQKQLKKQAYEFAVKDFAGTKKFTSKAAKRDFINSVLSEELDMDDKGIVGIDEFVSKYSAENEDAFVKEKETKEKSSENPKPRFVASTQGGATPEDETKGFASAFHFNEVHPSKK